MNIIPSGSLNIPISSEVELPVLPTGSRGGPDQGGMSLIAELSGPGGFG